MRLVYPSMVFLQYLVSANCDLMETDIQRYPLIYILDDVLISLQQQDQYDFKPPRETTGVSRELTAVQSKQRTDHS